MKYDITYSPSENTMITFKEFMDIVNKAQADSSAQMCLKTAASGYILAKSVSVRTDANGDQFIILHSVECDQETIR